MHTQKIDEADIRFFYDTVLALSDEEGCRELFDDLCTIKEVRQMAQRLKAARLLMAGLTYNQVIAETDISSATLSRVSRCVQFGRGYSRFVRPLSEEERSGK